jgi:hypothetical protein
LIFLSDMNMEQRAAQTLEFLKEHRSSEANFEKVAAKLDEMILVAREHSREELLNSLEELREKQLPVYLKAKENGSSYPEYEKLVSGFEVALGKSPG